MIRKTLTILSLVGLVLSVGLWGVSIFYGFHHVPNSARFRLSIAHGVVWVRWIKNPYPPMPTSELRELFREEGIHVEDDDDLGTAMFGQYNHPGTRVIAYDVLAPTFAFYLVPSMERRRGKYLIEVPLWTPLLLSVVLFCSLFLPEHRRRKRGKRGLCVACGYNLTGNLSGICPECGTPFEKP